MSKWRSFREFDRKGLLIDRVEGSLAFTYRGYVFDRRIFRSYMIGLFLLMVYIGVSSGVGWREFYVHCPTSEEVPAYQHIRGGWCANPCYLNTASYCEEIRDQELLPAGFTLGNPPSERFGQMLQGLFFAGVGGFIVAFSANHLLHNKGRPLEYIFRGDEL